MPRRKKKAHELTNDEIMRRVFPKEVVRAAKEEVEKARKSGEKKSTRKDST